jgi:catechol 2,3-dioxygenase-like lactoylglutathione lyase family enzyme
MAELPPPPEGILLAHFIVSDDVERSRRFYTEVLGGRVAFPGDPVNVALANSWIVINTGGGPTDDKPTVTLETPRDPDRVSSRMERQRRSIPDAAETARVREALLHPRSRRSPDRSGADHGPRGRLVARSLAIGYVRRGDWVKAEITREVLMATVASPRTLSLGPPRK